MNALLVVAVVLIIIAVLVVASAVRVLREYERGVIFRLGRLLSGPKGPGLILLVPFIDRMVKIDLRTVTLAIPPQEVITKDNVPVRVTAVTYFRVVDPQAAVTQIENYLVATSQIAQTTLRSVLGQHSLDELLAAARQDQRDPPGHHRPAHRALGHQDLGRRGQGRRAADDDAARDGAPGRGRARAARQDHRRAGRVRGRRAAEHGRRSHRREPDRAPAPLPADAARDLLVEQRDDDPADPDRHPAPAAGGGQGDRCGRAPRRPRRQGLRRRPPPASPERGSAASYSSSSSSASSSVASARRRPRCRP